MEFLPFPKKDHGWLAGIILIIIFFWIYYFPPFNFFSELEMAYYLNFWEVRTLNNTCQILNNQSEREVCFDVIVQIPKQFASAVEREVLVTVTNQNQTSEELQLLVTIDTSDAQGLTIILYETSVGELTSTSTNVMKFGTIPPGATTTRSLNVRAIPNRENAQSNLDELSINFEFWPITQEGRGQRLTPTGSVQSRFQPNKATIQSLIQNLLLPPWSNGLLVFLAILIPSFWENLYKPEREWGFLQKIGLFIGLIVILSFTHGGLLVWILHAQISTLNNENPLGPTLPILAWLILTGTAVMVQAPQEN